MEPSANTSIAAAPICQFKEIGFRHSRNLPSLLRQLQASLLVSTYQAGTLAVLGVRDNKLDLSFHNFDRPMGVATNRRSIAVGVRNQVWFLRSAAEFAPRLQPIVRGKVSRYRPKRVRRNAL